MKNRIFIAGGSGFLGRGIAERLLEAGYDVVAVVRRPSRYPLGERKKLNLREGDVLDPESLHRAMDGCRAVVNAVGILRERRRKGITYERLHLQAVRNLLAEVERAGAEHFVQISAMGARPDGVSRYQTTKYEAEREVRRRAKRWTVLRPSVVIGPGVGFAATMSSLARLPITPIFGDGHYRSEPVDKRVVADAVAAALESETADGAVFELRGPAAYTFDEILDHIGVALGRRRVRKFHFPLWLARLVVSATGRLPFSPINRDQLEMLVESDVGTGRDGVAELGLQVIDLPEQLEYAFRDSDLYPTRGAPAG